MNECLYVERRVDNISMLGGYAMLVILYEYCRRTPELSNAALNN